MMEVGVVAPVASPVLLSHKRAVGEEEVVQDHMRAVVEVEVLAAVQACTKAVARMTAWAVVVRIVVNPNRMKIAEIAVEHTIVVGVVHTIVAEVVRMTRMKPAHMR